MGVQYMICHWAINRTDPQNLLSTTLDVLLQMRLLEGFFTLYTSLSVRVSRIGAKLVCLSITSKQAKVVLECC